MKNRKYGKFIAYLVLFSYLFLFTATIFHYHHVEILGLDSIDKAESNRSQSDSIKNGLNCFVIQNFISLHTSITSILANNDKNPDFVDILVRIKEFRKLPSNLSANIYLRAPPFSFS